MDQQRLVLEKIDNIVNMAQEIYKTQKKLRKQKLKEDVILSQISSQFNVFCQEFPTVVQMIIQEDYFCRHSFIKYVNYRRSQPAVYKHESQSIDDLCQYPLNRWLLENPHANLSDKTAFTKELVTGVQKAHRSHKKALTEFASSVQTQIEQKKQERLYELQQNILERCQGLLNQ